MIHDLSFDIETGMPTCGTPWHQSVEVSQMGRLDDVGRNTHRIVLGSHSGTHLDAPYHFIDNAKTIDKVDLDKFIGYAYVFEHEGDVKKEDAEAMIKTAKSADERAAERILVKGKATVTKEAAEVFAAHKIKLFGNESQTVGPEDAPMAVHLIMLGAEIVLLEGIRLEGIEEGVYILNAAPINLGGSDGAPCRATLMKL